MINNLPLQIQRLGGAEDQVLIMTHIAALQRKGAASPQDIRDLFVATRVPPPSNVSEYLSRLARKKLVLRTESRSWTLTPEGEERIRVLMSSASDAALAMVGRDTGEAVFGEAAHHLIPAEMAPSAFRPGIGRFLAGHPFHRNVFCITRFPRASSDPVGPMIQACREVCAEGGLEMHLASDKVVEDLLFGNIAAAMWASKYGIAVFEDRAGEGSNPNVSLEAGSMLMTGRRCLLIRDETGKMPTDLVGHIYQRANIADTGDVRRVVRAWIRDLGA